MVEYIHDGFSPLHYAFLLMGHPNGSGAVASLLDAGADANAANSGGLTPLHYAAGHHALSGSQEAAIARASGIDGMSPQPTYC